MVSVIYIFLFVIFHVKAANSGPPKQAAPVLVEEQSDADSSEVKLHKRSPYYYYSSGGASYVSSKKDQNYGYYGYTDAYGYGFYYTGGPTSRGRSVSSSFSVKNNDFDLPPELDQYEIEFSNSMGQADTAAQTTTSAQYAVLYAAGGFGALGCGVLLILVFRRIGSGNGYGSLYDFSTEGNSTQYSYQSYQSAAAFSNASSYAPVGSVGSIPGASVYLPMPQQQFGIAAGGTAYGGYGSVPMGTAYGGGTAYGAGGSGGTAYQTRI